MAVKDNFNQPTDFDATVTENFEPDVTPAVEEKPKKKPKTKKKLSKKTIIFGGIGAFVLLIVLICVAKATIFKPKQTYYSQLDQIFSARLGYFSYTFRVESAARGTLKPTDISSEPTPTLGETESVSTDTTTGTEPEDDAPRSWDARTTDWGTADGAETYDWQYPCYEIKFMGNTTSLDPLTTHFDVIIANLDTGFSDTFTDITVIDGKYYINIEQMRYWLVHSKDSYLQSIGEKLPDGQKYLTFTEEEFVYHSRYAEEGDEFNLATDDSISDLYVKFLMIEKTILGQIHNYNGDNGLSASNDMYGINLNSDQLTPVFKGILNNSGDIYSGNIDSLAQAGIYDEQEVKQANREKDNFIASLSSLTSYFNIADSSMTNMSLTGTVREGVSEFNGIQELDGAFQLSYSLADKDVCIKATVIRTGKADEIVLPQGSTLALKDLNNQLIVEDTLNAVADYFNVFGVEFGKRIELTPANIRQSTIDDFIALINNQGCADHYITRNNVDEFLAKYSNYTEDSKTTDNDRICKAIVDDFYEEMNSITGGAVQMVYVEQEEEIDHYPTTKATVSGCDITIDYNETESTTKLVVCDLFILNPTEEEVTINLSDFSLNTYLSTYPYNNYTLLHDFDNSITEDDVQTEVIIQPSGFAKISIKAVINDDDREYADISYNGEKLGVVIQP